MALQEPFLARNVVGGFDAFAHLFRPVHQQHRLAVGQEPLDFFSGHIVFLSISVQILRRATQASCPPKPRELDRATVTGRSFACSGV